MGGLLSQVALPLLWTGAKGDYLQLKRRVEFNGPSFPRQTRGREIEASAQIG